MAATTSTTLKDQVSVSYGLVESATVNSISDFTPSKFYKRELNPPCDKNDDFINTFICHLIFYAVFCVSIVLHIFIDLGFGSFLKNKFIPLIGLENNTVFRRIPALA